MCGICSGKIILRTADGFENTIKVPDCRISEYRAPIRHQIQSAFFDCDDFPLEEIQNNTYRTYKWNGREKDGARILEEVVSNPPKKCKRSTEVLEMLFGKV